MLWNVFFHSRLRNIWLQVTLFWDQKHFVCFRLGSAKALPRREHKSSHLLNSEICFLREAACFRKCCDITEVLCFCTTCLCSNRERALVTPHIHVTTRPSSAYSRSPAASSLVSLKLIYFRHDSTCQWGQCRLCPHWPQLYPVLCPCMVLSLTLPSLSSWPAMFHFPPHALTLPLLLAVSRCSIWCPTPPLVSFHHDVEFCCQHEWLQLLLWVRKRCTALRN